MSALQSSLMHHVSGRKRRKKKKGERKRTCKNIMEKYEPVLHCTVAWCWVGRSALSTSLNNNIHTKKSKSQGFSSTNLHKVSPHLCDLTHAMCTAFVTKKYNFCPPPLASSLQSLTPLKGHHLTLQLEISFAHKNGTTYYTWYFRDWLLFKNVLFERSRPIWERLAIVYLFYWCIGP